MLKLGLHVFKMKEKLAIWLSMVHWALSWAKWAYWWGYTKANWAQNTPYILTEIYGEFCTQFALVYPHYKTHFAHEKQTIA